MEKETDCLLWICPQCGRVVRFPNIQSANLAENAGMCRDCRAAGTLSKHPELAWLYDDFSRRSGIKYSCLDCMETDINCRRNNVVSFS